MRPIVLILMVIGLVTAVLTAFLAKRWLEPAPTAPVDVAEVLVAARPVAMGTVLQGGDLRYDKWAPAAVNPLVSVKTPTDDPAARFSGSVVRVPLAEGEALTQAAVFKQDSSGLMAGLLAPGMRAVSIAISNPSAVSGFVTPGDRVDIMLAADIAKSESTANGPIVHYASETVLKDVRVLAIDQQIVRGHESPAMQGKTATVEVTPKQAEILTTAALIGQLSLVLRGIAKAEGADQDDKADKLPFTADTEASKALFAIHSGAFQPDAPAAAPAAPRGHPVKINRGGDITSKTY